MKINLETAWTGGMKGSGHITSPALDTEISIPTVYGGAGIGSNPKELYVASTVACFASTLTAISTNKKLPLAQLSVTTEADADDDKFVIVHHAHVVLNADATEQDIEKAESIVASADKVCVVGNLARKAGVEVSAIAHITLA